MTRVQTIEIRCEVDTGKETHGVTAQSLPALVAWWNEQAPALGLPVYTLVEEP